MYSSTTERQRRVGVQALAAELYTQQRGRLLAIARRNTANNADAEEALEDAFVSFLEHFDPNGTSPPLAWLTLTLKRRCWANRHRQMPRPSAAMDAQHHPGGFGDPVDPRPLPEEVVEVSDAITGLRAGLAQLKPNERRALVLFACGYSYLEIAELNHWTYTKVNRCIREGRAALRARAAGV